MEEEKKEATQTLWKALIIGNSFYNKDLSKLNDLPSSKANLERVYEMCKNRMNIKESDISMMFNNTAIQINDEFKRLFLKPSKKAS